MGYRPAGNGTLFMTLLGSPVLGLIPAIPASLTSPAARNLSIPLKEFEANHIYLESYTRHAHKIKKNRIWTNYAIGGVVSISFGILVYYSINSIGVGTGP